MVRNQEIAELGFALVAVGVFCVLRGLYSWSDSDTPPPYKESTLPATPTKRVLVATLGLALIAAGAWLIRTYPW